MEIPEDIDSWPEFPLPEWAIARLNGEYVLGAQLPTRDGRRTGNAHIIGTKACSATGATVYCVLTDAGTEFWMLATELAGAFYPPEYQSSVRDVLRKFSRKQWIKIGAVVQRSNGIWLDWNEEYAQADHVGRDLYVFMPEEMD